MSRVNVGPVNGAIWVQGSPQITNAVEVARMWIENGGLGTFFIQPDNLETPEMFGMMMTDCVRHAARAFSQRLGISEGQALDRIWQGLDAERDHQTDEPTTIEPYSKDLN